MIKNYFKIAWRNLWRNKVFSIINIISLAIGLSASFIIGAMVFYDFTFDKFHPGGERIYRITSDFESPEGASTFSGVPVPLTAYMKKAVPGVEMAGSFITYSPLRVKNNSTEQTYEDPGFMVFTDESYFELFQYEWLAGSPETALNGPNKVVLTKSRAKKYFPKLNTAGIMGKTLIYNDSVGTIVTGIVADFEKRSDLVFREFVSIETAAQTEIQIQTDNWNATNSNTQLFIKINESTKISDIQKRLDILAEEHELENADIQGRHRTFHLQPLEELHFSTDYGIFDEGNSPADKSVLLALAGIALFLLLLGCINFINLSTAFAAHRTKEIGIRKTLGSSKKQLIFQFLGETFLLTVLAAILSLVFAFWLLRLFSDFIPSGLTMEIFAEPVIIGFAIVLLLVVSLLSGFYPALILSRFKPVSVIQNQLVPQGNKSMLRKSLIVFQFTIAQIFIIATLLVGKQIQFMAHKDMGFKTEAVAFVRTPWQEKSLDKRKRFMKEINALPQIEKTSLGWAPPASFYVNMTVVGYADGENKIHTNLNLLFGDLNYLELYDIKLLAGRNLLNETAREFIINETCLKKLGFDNPQDAIGKFLEYNENLYPIVGVMEDFNQRSLKMGIQPMAFIGDWHREHFSQFNTVHFLMPNENRENWPGVIEKIKEIWGGIYPNADFELKFVDETTQQFYEREQQTAKLLKWATGLSILISCLGLLGLVVYTTERRAKEIGIRKILGASLRQLNFLMCKDFLSLVLLAFIIAAPIAWLALNDWLRDFAYKTDLSWWIFLMSGAAMLLLALIVMSVITLATASKNPVKSLRTE